MPKVRRDGRDSSVERGQESIDYKLRLAFERMGKAFEHARGCKAVQVVVALRFFSGDDGGQLGA